MSDTLDCEATKLGLYRDVALGILFASSISFGAFLLLNSRSRGASALDTKLALGSLAVAALCIILAPHKLSILTVGAVLIVVYSITALLLRLIGIRSPIVGIAEIALGAALLYFEPPAWHKRYFRLTFPALLLLHGAYQFFHR